MKKIKTRVLLVILVVILIIILLGYILLHIIKFNEEETFEPIELITIKEPHCDSGYCVKDYNYRKINEKEYELKFVFENTNETAIEKECVKIYYTEESYLFSCFEYLGPSESRTDTIVIENDLYSEYEDFKVEKVSQTESDKYYDVYLNGPNGAS